MQCDSEAEEGHVGCFNVRLLVFPFRCEMRQSVTQAGRSNKEHKIKEKEKKKRRRKRRGW